VKLKAIAKQQTDGLLVAEPQHGQPGGGAAGKVAAVTPGGHHLQVRVEDGGFPTPRGGSR
jgi:hypothetical protein